MDFFRKSMDETSDKMKEMEQKANTISKVHAGPFKMITILVAQMIRATDRARILQEYLHLFFVSKIISYL